MPRWASLVGGVSVAGIGGTSLGYKKYYDPVRYKSSDDISDSYDYIVIGAGTSGSVVARRLAEQTHKPSVLLVEAGGPDTYHPLSNQVIPIRCRELLRSEVDWQYFTEPNQDACLGLIDKRSYWPRGKVMGGSSVMNAMFYVRGHKDDYNEWNDKHGCKGWDYQSVLPYFKKIENITFQLKNDKDVPFRGTDGLQSVSLKKPFAKACDLFIRACENNGYDYNEDYNGESQDGVAYIQYNTCKGRRQTSFRSYIEPLFKWNGKTQYNIDILGNAHVCKIVTDAHNKKAKAVEFAVNDSNKKKVVKSAENGGQIILCAGAIGSPQILLHSGIGPSQELEAIGIDCVADLPGVGKNLHDHMLASVRLKVPKTVELCDTKAVLSPVTIFKYLFKGEGWMTTMLTDVHLFCKSEAGKKLGLKMNDLQLVGCPVTDMLSNDNLESGYNMAIPKDMPKKAAEDVWSFNAMVFPLQPQSLGEITLKNNDPFDYPKIDYDYLQTQYDRDSFVDGILLLKQILTSDPFKSIGCEMVVPADVTDLETYWSREQVLNRLKAIALTCYHPVGTCKMGNIENDEMAVCDERLVVKGFDNLRVMDASIMPRVTSGNTQAPCYMIGEKGSHMLIQDQQNEK